jgi:hypothetical protein
LGLQQPVQLLLEGFGDVVTAEGVFDGLDADDSRRVAAQVAFDFLRCAPAAAEAVAIMDRALRCRAGFDGVDWADRQIVALACDRCEGARSERGLTSAVVSPTWGTQPSSCTPAIRRIGSDARLGNSCCEGPQEIASQL